MGLLGKNKGKSSNFVFLIHVHSLGPWPTNYKSLAVTWERGSKHGTTSVKTPLMQPGESWTSYVWEETIQLPTTLYQVAGTLSYF
jgi:N-terminal C2 in EEIG1 and EHBP1 proteins